MIKSISIRNYALIDALELEIAPGFSVITGETGAGKSILLGAIGLTAGARADASVVADKTRKCIAEVTYAAAGYGLQEWFLENDLDYADDVVARREIHPDGRSRAFINDTPVNNKTLKELGEYLVDIHSQHQSLLIGQPGYQMEVLDRFRANLPLLDDYRARHAALRRLERELLDARRAADDAAREEEFLAFQHDRLEAARLREGEQQELEEELHLLSHAGEIRSTLEALVDALTGSETPVVQALRACRHRLSAISGVYDDARAFDDRLQSITIELQDIADEASRRADRVEYSPERAAAVRERLDTLYGLLHKHDVATADDLVRLRDTLSTRLRAASNLEEHARQLASTVSILTAELDDVATRLHEARAAGIPSLENEMQALLSDLGMPHARFSISLESLPTFTPTGKDRVTFLFSANRNHSPGELSRVASGGEVSRLMLSMKYILSSSKLLPAIIFDEIDTGVSGEIAHRVASMLRRMSTRMQVISISHLPQIAAAGTTHFKVYKEDSPLTPLTRVRSLTPDERVLEIAAMISGSTITDAAIANARSLLHP